MKTCKFCNKKATHIGQYYDSIKNTNGEIVEEVVTNDDLCFSCMKKYKYHYSIIVKV